MNLYEMSTCYNQIKDLDLEEEEIEKLLNITEEDFDKKVENIIKVIKSIEGENLAIKAEQNRLRDMAYANTSKIDSLKKYIDTNMKLIDKDKLNAGLFKVSYRKSTVLNVLDQNLIPLEFIKIIPEQKQVDKVELKKYMKDHEVKGAELEHKQNLQIK